MLKKFVENIEQNIYAKELIYRSVLLVQNNKECIRLKNLLEKNDHSCLIFENISEDIDYHNIDYRIIIMCHNKFKMFFDYLSDMGYMALSSYNFIALSETIGETDTSDCISYYMSITNNNSCKTIIMDKNYLNISYLNKIMC